MYLLEQYERRKDALARIGEHVRAEARATGTTVSYCEPAFGDDVIREYPDGHRERLQADGKVTPLPPRAA